MREAAGEERILERLCGELLSASDLKAIGRARGFPVVGGPREKLAEAVSARFLDPLGLAEAMGSLGGPALAALHLVAAAEEPLPLGALHPVFDAEGDPYEIDYRTLWRRVSADLLAKGVLLADDEEYQWSSRERSRFARFRLLLPEGFRPFLPPFPVPTEPCQGKGEGGSSREFLAGALAAFAALGTPKEAAKKGAERGPLPARVARAFRIEDGVLGLRGFEGSNPVRLLRWLTACWGEGLPQRDELAHAPPAGRVARHALGHLPPGRGCTPQALSQALASVGLRVKPSTVSSFCEEGTMAGLVRRYPRGAGEALYRLEEAVEPPHAEEAHLVVRPERGGVRVDGRASDLLLVLDASRASRAQVVDGALLLEPDVVRMGRAWGEIGKSAAMATLRAASRAFEEAAGTLEGRRGQVTVHRGLTVLRVDDVGLRAAVRSRFAGSVREVAGEYLAVLRASAEDVLAFARKEGFVARRVP